MARDSVLSSGQFEGPPGPAPWKGPEGIREDSEGPLPLGAYSYGTTKYNTAWRKPKRVMPYSSATAGSVFQPFGPST